MIAKESIENLKNNLDIVDILSQFVQLKKSGANFKACCPFHGENTPSFVVSPAKQIYHCFGCGVGGDAIKFVMDYEKLSYPEAIEKIASMTNFSLHYTADTNQKPSIDTTILESINSYYKKSLIDEQNVKEYLQSRGISEYLIEKFEIGYAPSSKDTINYINQNFLNIADAKELGVLSSGENGLYARFIERITFPIYTHNEKLVGFGGRTITGHGAKYVNSPQTKLFNKSRLLYGYHLAKKSIMQKKEIIVTEGYLDVIMLHSAGFDNAVATLGTALTNEHLPLLKRGEPKVILAYDSDKAGLVAASKAAQMLLINNFEGGVVLFDEGCDPADMVKDSKIPQLNDIFNSPIPFAKFIINFIVREYDLSVPEMKQKALVELNQFLNSINPLLQEEYKSYIASKLNINPSLVKTTLSKQPQRKYNVDLSTCDIAELSVIKAIAEYPEFVTMILDVCDSNMFSTHKQEFEMVLNNQDEPQIRALLLNESIKSYSKEELKQQLQFFLIKFHEKNLTLLMNDSNLDYKEKSTQIRKTRELISSLKSGSFFKR
ncbi:DNA primase [Arcobacter sp. FWKO B]|uniref:DNA primase n=1 Tax=Arcobacter sp. FWKO B TaxID=2593672 RepID=UPI0018A4F835|nr:DNA primase [Arcobacter sp. FWKO B]QOG11775.1 DNA primase [Arcobacter sp. FWKO B]